jgi:hypothetical protein
MQLIALVLWFGESKVQDNIKKPNLNFLMWWGAGAFKDQGIYAAYASQLSLRWSHGHGATHLKHRTPDGCRDLGTSDGQHG